MSLEFLDALGRLETADRRFQKRSFLSRHEPLLDAKEGAFSDDFGCRALSEFPEVI